MKEFELIDRLTRSLHANSSLLSGPGDDCAVLDLGMPDQVVLFKTDAVVQDVHFKISDAPEQVGHKALGRCLSDIAAMAGTPTAALVTLALPSEFDPAYLEKLYLGMNRLAERYDFPIAGGDNDQSRTIAHFGFAPWVDNTRSPGFAFRGQTG